MRVERCEKQIGRSLGRAPLLSGPNALCVPARALSVSGPGAAPRHSLSGSLSGPSGPLLTLFLSGPGGLCRAPVEAQCCALCRGLALFYWGPALCRGLCRRPAVLAERFVHRAQAVSVSVPRRGVCVGAAVLSQRCLCRGPALSASWGPALSVSGPDALCQGPATLSLFVLGPSPQLRFACSSACYPSTL